MVTVDASYFKENRLDRYAQGDISRMVCAGFRQ